ncbi:spore germination protein [Alkaliphilus sp. MSJ-5]|uniref:Spore germination protein n=1 Tax=Alkaliphilus flagellatus TaxID=2841507 RepID=A0ABS6FZU7_9FIRM|nr:spore germination protein [Alkaliphilus flagellatus]MBU5674923.1 spore germination protein [Alkaliphilus flagellatus]
MKGITKMAKTWLDYIKENLYNNNSIIYRELKVDRGIINIVYDNDACDRQIISQFIISPIITTTKSFNNIETIKREIIETSSVIDVENKEKAIEHILSGEVILIFGFLNKVIACHAENFAKRQVEVPSAETVIKGPRVGFNESIDDNVSALKKIIKDPNLKFESIVIGEKSKTKVAIAYIKGSIPPHLIEYVKQKLNNVTTDYLIYGNYIEEELKCKLTPFDTIGFTEKPDTAAVDLAEGKILILVDGTPFVISAPFFFIENFHTTDDYTTNKFMSNFGVILRWGSFILSTLVPGLYVALFTHHFNLIPYVFIFRVASSRAGVPFPMIIEVIVMIVFFQILREAGVRLPQPIGPTLSIVGALILGDAAVRSGLTSHVTVLIVAITSIAAFLVPKVSAGIFTWSIIILLFSTFLGLPGFYTGFVLFCSHLAGLTSCGYPYLYPLGTLGNFKYKDIFLTGELDKINQYIFIKDDDKE